MGRNTQDEITRDILDRIRTIEYSHKDNSFGLLKEENEKDGNIKSDAIAITDDPRFGQNTLSNQIQQFRTSVEGGAQFTKPTETDVAEAPLIYIPSTNNLIFSGIIPCLNNLKWQFVLKTNTGNGCFVWADGLILNKDNMQILNKLYGFYCNWKEQWQQEATDLEKMAEHLKND